MIELWHVLLAITGLFFVHMGFKEFLKGKLKDNFCVVCAAISSTWIILLLLYWNGLFANKTLLALLIGESVVGIFYMVNSKVKEELKVFRFPFLMTLIVVGYTLIENSYDFVPVILIVIILWIIFATVYFLKMNHNISLIAKKLVECCKEW